MEPTKPEFVPWPEGGETEAVAVEGGKVLCHIYGRNSTGIPMIFLHGGPGGRCSCFFKQIPLSRKHPMVFYNQLGSSGSDFDSSITTARQVREYLTIEHYVNELDTLVQHFGFREFLLVGSSWGTMLAVEYAAAKQPEGLRGLVLNGPFLSVDTWISDAQRLIRSLPEGDSLWREIQECEQAGNYSERYAEINKLYSKNFNNRTEGSTAGTPTEPETRVVDGVSVYNTMWGPSEFSCTGTLRGHDSTPLLPSIRVPVLYVSGQYDSGTPQAAFHYQSLTPNGEVCVLPGCAHNSMRERSAEFNAVLEGFAERI